MRAGTAVLLYAAGALGTTLLTPLSGGALRIGDWVAHWFLVLVYIGEPLPDLRTFTNRVGDFGVISRPPLYNLEGGLLVGALDSQFWPFQLLTPLLGLSVAGAAVLWARNIGGARAVRIMVPLVGLSPFLLQNASYPWSKMVAGGLVLLFLAMIRAAALARQPRRARQLFVLAALCARAWIPGAPDDDLLRHPDDPLAALASPAHADRLDKWAVGGSFAWLDAGYLGRGGTCGGAGVCAVAGLGALHLRPARHD